MKSYVKNVNAGVIINNDREESTLSLHIIASVLLLQHLLLLKNYLYPCLFPSLLVSTGQQLQDIQQMFKDVYEMNDQTHACLNDE